MQAAPQTPRMLDQLIFQLLAKYWGEILMFPWQCTNSLSFL